jgi:hypothetical protein
MKILAAFLLAFLALPLRAANTWGTDISDLWYNSRESGWGLNISHQQELLFATLFVYGADGRARWFVASELRSTNGEYSFTGPLYETSGPGFAGVFNPANVTVRQVGTMTFSLSNVGSGVVSYSVDGAIVVKDVVRQTFRNQDMSGSYLGFLAGTRTGCTTAGNTALSAPVTITQIGTSFSMTGPANNMQACNYVGTYRQFGRIGDVEATVSCGGVAVGAIVIFEIEAGYSGFFSRYSAQYGSCIEEGRLLGIR